MADALLLFPENGAPRRAPASRTDSLPKLLRYAARMDVDVTPILRRHQLPADTTQREDVSVSLQVLRAVGDEVAARIGLDVGLQVAEANPNPFRAPEDYAARSAPTLKAALDVIARYGGELNGWAAISLEETDEGVSLHQRVRGERLAFGRAGNELATAQLLQLVRALVPEAQPLRVWFAHAAPEDLTHVKKTFGERVSFDSGENGFELPSAVLERALASADPILAKILERSVLVPRVSPPDFLSAVRQQIRTGLREGDARVEAVAARLHMSSRTLQRRLGLEGVAYQELLGECQATLAETLLQDPNLTLGEVAYQLGYSDTRGLVRAFRRWKGMTPGEYRRLAG